MFISGIKPAQDINLLIERDIGGVLNCCGELAPKPTNENIPNFILNIRDGAAEKVSYLIYEVFAFV